MSLLTPLWLWLGVAGAAAVTLMHFFARQRPRPAPLPTARFVPDVAARAPSPARQPTDLLLLVLRVLALLVAGLALARPVVRPERRLIGRVVVADDSAALDSARAHATEGDSLVTAPTLSAGLILAIRASTALRDHVDSIELVIASPFTAQRFDAATDSIRRLWPGRARLVRVAVAAEPASRRIELVGTGDDPLRAAIALLGPRSGAVSRIARGALTPADSAFASGGGVLVAWPRDPTSPVADTVGAVAAGGVVVVAAFARPTLQLSSSPAFSVVAHWVDGAPAAVERAVGAGCIRDVAVPIPSTGDLVLRRSVRDLVDALAAPCGGPRSSTPASANRLAVLAAAGPLMPARLAPEPPERRSSASAWLLGLVAVLLLAEQFARPGTVRV